MRLVGASNEFFYYTQSGQGGIFDIRFRIDFSSDISVRVMKDSVSRALELYPEFSVRPVIKENRLWYEENSAPAPVFEEERIICFGTDDTNGYLFEFVCKGRKMLISLYHGISDAIGVFSFVRTALYFYMKGTGRTVPTEKGTAEQLGIRLDRSDIPDLDRQDTFDPYRAFGDASCEPEWKYDNPGAFVIPEKTNDPSENAFRVFDVTISVKEFLAKTKEIGVSVVPLLGAIAAKVIASVYDTEGKPINAMLPVNLRTQFETSTLVNMSDGVILPVSAQMLEKPIGEIASELKTIMRAQMTKNNYCRIIANKVAAVETFENKGDIFEAAKAGATPPPLGSVRPVTYALTYPGKIDLPDAYAGLVENYSVCTLVRAFSLLGVTYGDRMQIEVLQRFDSDKLVNAIANEFRAFGLDAELFDHGIEQGNLMILEKLKKA